MRGLAISRRQCWPLHLAASRPRFRRTRGPFLPRRVLRTQYTPPSLHPRGDPAHPAEHSSRSRITPARHSPCGRTTPDGPVPRRGLRGRRSLSGVGHPAQARLPGRRAALDRSSPAAGTWGAPSGAGTLRTVVLPRGRTTPDGGTPLGEIVAERGRAARPDRRHRTGAPERLGIPPGARTPGRVARPVSAGSSSDGSAGRFALGPVLRPGRIAFAAARPVLCPGLAQRSASRPGALCLGLMSCASAWPLASRPDLFRPGLSSCVPAWLSSSAGSSWAARTVTPLSVGPVRSRTRSPPTVPGPVRPASPSHG